MFSVYINKAADIAVLEVELYGARVLSSCARRLHRNARVVFVDLSEVNALVRWWTRHAHFLYSAGLTTTIFNSSYSIRRNLSEPGWNMPARCQSLKLPCVLICTKQIDTLIFIL